MKLTNEDVQAILRLIDSSSYDELNIETEDFRLMLRRSGPDGGWSQRSENLAEPNVVAGLSDAQSEKTAVEAPEPSDTASVKPGEGLTDIAAPLIGTFYRAPKPGADPFVKVGDGVSENTVVGIIEVMKLMNSVPAGLVGEVAEICAVDGEFVEQGQVLMRVRTAE